MDSQKSNEQKLSEEMSKFVVQRIYIKQLSFQSPKSPATFSDEQKPTVHVDVNSRYSAIESGIYESVMSVSLRAKNDNHETRYLVEFQQAGLFGIQGLSEPELEQVLSIRCPEILFPYAREMLDSLLIRGGFPPLLMVPPDFEGLYKALLANKKPADGGGGWEPPPEEPVMH